MAPSTPPPNVTKRVTRSASKVGVLCMFCMYVLYEGMLCYVIHVYVYVSIYVICVYVCIST